MGSFPQSPAAFSSGAWGLFLTGASGTSRLVTSRDSTHPNIQVEIQIRVANLVPAELRIPDFWDFVELSKSGTMFAQLCVCRSKWSYPCEFSLAIGKKRLTEFPGYLKMRLSTARAMFHQNPGLRLKEASALIKPNLDGFVQCCGGAARLFQTRYSSRSRWLVALSDERASGTPERRLVRPDGQSSSEVIRWIQSELGCWLVPVCS